MTDNVYNFIITSVAKKHHKPVDEVVEAMQDALYDMFVKRKGEPGLQPLINGVKRKGEIPTVREFFEFLQEENDPNWPRKILQFKPRA